MGMVNFMNIKIFFRKINVAVPVREILRGFQKFANLLTDAINLALLTFVYFLGFGLTKLFAIIFKKHFLEIIREKNSQTCWKEIARNEYKNGDFYRMF